MTITMDSTTHGKKVPSAAQARGHEDQNEMGVPGVRGIEPDCQERRRKDHQDSAEGQEDGESNPCARKIEGAQLVHLSCRLQAGGDRHQELEELVRHRLRKLAEPPGNGVGGDEVNRKEGTDDEFIGLCLQPAAEGQQEEGRTVTQYRPD
jgi:hypothetical protein